VLKLREVVVSGMLGGKGVWGEGGSVWSGEWCIGVYREWVLDVIVLEGVYVQWFVLSVVVQRFVVECSALGKEPLHGADVVRGGIPACWKRYTPFA
jgi:hypothetical protein